MTGLDHPGFDLPGLDLSVSIKPVWITSVSIGC